MVIVRLKGGLGNQLFQFAFGRRVAIERNEGLYFDMSYFTNTHSHITPREFKLTSLLNYQMLDNRTNSLLHKWYQLDAVALISDSYDKNLLSSLLKDHRIKAVVLDGYYQDEFYFAPYKRIICTEIKELLDYHYKNSDIKDAVNWSTERTVSVHVRRGDYLRPSTLKFHGICETKYYENAVEQILEKVSNPIFYLFSDDIKEAEQIFVNQLKLINTVSISGSINGRGFQNQDIIEMAIMSNCDHHIIANSSFSWWAAYLSDFPKQTVIAPKHWYKDVKMKQLSDEIIPASWIRI